MTRADCHFLPDLGWHLTYRPHERELLFKLPVTGGAAGCSKPCKPWGLYILNDAMTSRPIELAIRDQNEAVSGGAGALARHGPLGTWDMLESGDLAALQAFH